LLKKFNFGTKAETLRQLENILETATVLPQVSFSIAEWKHDPIQIFVELGARSWLKKPLIVRSSALHEDSPNQSLAGHFVSVPNVVGEDQIRQAIEDVQASYGPNLDSENQLLIQPMLEAVQLAGVAFSCDPNTGGPYRVVSYAKGADAAQNITGGQSDALQTYYHHKAADNAPPKEIGPVLSLITELESAANNQPLDIEFALDAQNQLYLLQVRPLVTKTINKTSVDSHAKTVQRISQKIAVSSKPHPYLAGKTAIYGVMPDWNPAEIIGLRPKALSLSLYRELVTDSTWAYQRDNYGYRSLRGFPLLVSFEGLPYIDVRTSFNSFVPKDLSEPLADRLVQYYLDRLTENPSWHDKVEFEIVYSCYTFDISDRMKALSDHGFSSQEMGDLSKSLLRITNNILNEKHGLWIKDKEKIDLLKCRRAAILETGLTHEEKIYWLLEDCRRYGTLPFAGLARAGFIAVQILNSLEALNILDKSDVAHFMGSLQTVSSQLQGDLGHLSKEDFLHKYGHLRPGTYEIDSPRYDEEPNRYFTWNPPLSDTPLKTEKPLFQLMQAQENAIASLLEKHGMDQDVAGLFKFIRAAIEGREYAKFIFTHSLSDALSLFGEFGSSLGFSLSDLAFSDITLINHLQATSNDPISLLKKSIEEGKKQHELTKRLVLPPLLKRPADAWAFFIPPAEPNFITLEKASGRVATDLSDSTALSNAIVFLPSADPGYDWIFASGITGFITKFGGVNSHMAIRAGEMLMPAVIGAGEILYEYWASAQTIEIDCAGRRVQILQ